MTVFDCRLARPDGTKVALHRTAVSQEVLLRDLHAEGYLVLGLEAAGASRTASPRRLRAASVIKFTEVLSTLLANGLSLKEALSLSKNIGGKELRSFLEALVAQVQKGTSLHQALVEGPRGFSPLYLGLVRIGEQTGDLMAIFPRLSEYLKSRQSLSQKTVNALLYPAFVLTVALVGIGLLSVFVLPLLLDAIGGINPQAAQQYRANVSGFQILIGGLSGLLVVLLVGFVALGTAIRRSPGFALAVDSVLLSLPLYGTLTWQSFGLHVSFALEILLTSGFSLEAALGECTPIIKNQAQRRAWEKVRERVTQGSSLSHALDAEKIFPGVFLGWVEVGESAHDLKRSFQQLRTFYQNQLDVVSTRFTNLAEPTLIVLVGGMMIALVFTFITPIFTMMGRLY